LYAGTGLGLAIVKQLLEAQGGSICVESTLHAGSTFSFMLSFKKNNAVAELENEIMELDSQMKNVKILVVEDITLNQMLMKTILDDLDLIVRLPKMVK
jgi:hypoxanthine-guanine phosphoribosyltransferase